MVWIVIGVAEENSEDHSNKISGLKYILLCKCFPWECLTFTVRMEKAVGVFQHEKSEGLEEYLTTMGVPWMVRCCGSLEMSNIPGNTKFYRKVLANTSPTIEIVKEGEEWNLTFKVCVFI